MTWLDVMIKYVFAAGFPTIVPDPWEFPLCIETRYGGGLLLSKPEIM
jgi:hypothetical protein